jgi:Ser/Thr protein kinase RdoA (MazF antagonist)
VANVIKSGLAWLDTLPAQDYGLIHGDFELDNLVWDGERVQVLDFDAAVYTWYAVDIATTLQDVWFGADIAGADREQRLDWFFRGYTEISPLPGGLRSMLPRFLKLLIAVKVARLLQAYSTTIDRSDPEWLTKMSNYHQYWLVAKRAVLQQDIL